MSELVFGKEVRLRPHTIEGGSLPKSLLVTRTPASKASNCSKQ
jgi:hypothetical protein